MPTKPIELKVIWSTLGSLAASIALAVLIGWQADTSLIPGVPTWLIPILVIVVPQLVTFLSGYVAPHTSRPDLALAAAPALEAFTTPAETHVHVHLPTAQVGADDFLTTTHSITAAGEPVSALVETVTPSVDVGDH